MSDSKTQTQTTRFINIRKLAALDIVLHGATLILAEFGFSVFFAGGLGLFLLHAGIVAGHIQNGIIVLFGAWLVSLALNYLPLFLYAIDITRRQSAQAEVAHDLADKDTFVRKNTLQSLFLILPLIVPILALVQETRKQRA